MAGFSSCGSDDDDYSANDLVGTWKSTKSSLRVTTSNGKATELLNALLITFDNEDESIYTFNENATFEDKAYVGDPDPDTGEYRVSGNKLYFKYANETVEKSSTIKSLSNLSLDLEYSGKLDESLESYVDDMISSEAVESLRVALQAVGVDITTVTVKNVKYTSTYTKVTAQ